MQRYPELKLDLRFNDRVVDLVAEQIDVAVRVGAVRPKSYVARRIATTRNVIVAAPAYLAAAGRPLRPEDLAGHRLLGLASGATGRAHEWRLRGSRAPVTEFAARSTSPRRSSPRRSPARARANDRPAGRRADRPRPAGDGARRLRRRRAAHLDRVSRRGARLGAPQGIRRLRRGLAAALAREPRARRATARLSALRRARGTGSRARCRRTPRGRTRCCC